MYTVSGFLDYACKQYDPHKHDRLGVEVIIAHVLGKTREQLIIDSKEIITEEQIQECVFLLERFAMGEPVAYLLESKEFYGLCFYVDKRVLIPRPETELLVDAVLEFVKSFPDSEGTMWKIVDIGTGSGCIAIALASHLPKAMVLGTDISTDALAVAAKNIARYKLQTKVILQQANLLEPLQNVDNTIVEPFDIVVANLPYIGTEQYKFVSREAYDYEPHQALFGGSNGLQLYENLFRQLKAKTWKPRLILGEFGFLQGDAMQKLLEEFFPGQWEIQLDGAGIERMFMVGDWTQRQGNDSRDHFHDISQKKRFL